MSGNSRFMSAAIALSERGRALSSPNPNVGCIIERDGRVLGRGWTQAGGRPHAEAMALEQAGGAARGACVWVTLEPCAHESERGPACANLLIAAGVARVVIAAVDPDRRTNGQGIVRLRGAGITVETGLMEVEAKRAMAGWWSRRTRGRPYVTLKLAASLDGQIAMANGESRWITGAPARAHAHLERARSNAILVGRGTWDRDAPKLDVRLPGLEGRSPSPIILSGSRRDAETQSQTSSLRLCGLAEGQVYPERLQGSRRARTVASPAAIAELDADWLLVEGGAETAASFLREDVVDRLLFYRAPIMIGRGKAALGDLGLGSLGDAHGRWQLIDARQLGSDRLEAYERA